MDLLRAIIPARTFMSNLTFQGKQRAKKENKSLTHSAENQYFFFAARCVATFDKHTYVKKHTGTHVLASKQDTYYNKKKPSITPSNNFPKKKRIIKSLFEMKPTMFFELAVAHKKRYLPSPLSCKCL